MKRLMTALFACLLTFSTLATAHGDFDHVRGTVTQVTPQTIVVETPDKTTKTLALSSKTTYKKSGKTTDFSSLKIGDRIVADVHKGTLNAEVVQIGGAPAHR